MKKFLLMLLTLAVTNTFSQEKNIKSEVKSATVFLKSAQVTRAKTISMNKGIQVLKFTDLSPFIDKKSIQIKAKDMEIQAINFQKNFLSTIKKSPKYIELKKQFSDYAARIDVENINLSSIQEEIQFLKDNRDIGGSNQKLTVDDLKLVSQYYSSQMKSLKTKELNSKNKIKKLKDDKQKIFKQLSDLKSKKEFASGEIVVKVKSESSRKVNFELTYNVDNVSWYPSYDIRVKDINSPLQLTYKANLKQNSQVDWKNVKLRFSSSNPSQSTKAGKIVPYFIGYGTLPPQYKGDIYEVSGYVRDDYDPLPGASVVVKGTSIGTETDMNGYFSIKIPNQNSVLQFSSLGFESLERTVAGSFMDVRLKESGEVLDEVVVTGRGSSSKRYTKKHSVSSVLMGKTSGIRIRGASSLPNKTINTIPVQKIINQTSVSFEVVEPYTINSSNKNFVIAMKNYTTNADYRYYAVPRIEEQAFLVASLKNWVDLNLMEGEANIYFEDTFVGSSLIDTRYTEDDLDVSLGIDKNVLVSRKKAKDFTTRQFIGNKKEETSIWDFTIKNNKQQTIQMTVLDQIPIPLYEEIRVSLDKSFDGELNDKTGEVKWKFSLTPNNTKKMQLKYKVKYPKNQYLAID